MRRGAGLAGGDESIQTQDSSISLGGSRCFGFRDIWECCAVNAGKTTEPSRSTLHATLEQVREGALELLHLGMTAFWNY